LAAPFSAPGGFFGRGLASPGGFSAALRLQRVRQRAVAAGAGARAGAPRLVIAAALLIVVIVLREQRQPQRATRATWHAPRFR
jgi:hypothetical protein